MLAKKYARLRIILNDSIKAPEPTYVIDETRKELYINTDDKKYQGYLGIALQNTFYELLNNDSYEESIINIIKRGGDTDTNCAIAGALLGAYYGYSKIDPRWIKEINNATVKRYEEFPFLSPKMINKNIDLLIPKS